MGILAVVLSEKEEKFRRDEGEVFRGEEEDKVRGEEEELDSKLDAMRKNNLYVILYRQKKSEQSEDLFQSKKH